MTRRSLFLFIATAICIVCLRLAFPAAACAQARVTPVFATPPNIAGNVDSCAVWVAPDPRDSLLFATEKDGDRIEVWRAPTGVAYAPRPFLGGVADGTGPGEFNRPNGVWIIYHVPYAQGFADILLVTDQMNNRVQVIRLPGLEYFGEFGKGQVGKGYGIAWYQDGTDFFVYITDNSPPPGFPGKIKKYRLRPEGNLLGADLLFGVGSSAGTPPLPNVESIVADLANDRLHVCGDEGGRFNRIFRLDGTYTGIDYGDPQFEFDQEGINIYDTGDGRGYLLVSDQHTDGTPNEFEIFDRASLASKGNFRSAAGPIVTTNTDGDYLEQRPLAGFPNGAFYAVNDDRDVHAYDWTDIAEAMGLEIVALDRSFPAGSGAGGPRGPSRRSLWFEDGSFWGAFPRGGALAIWRLEDGTFSPQGDIDAAAPASVWSGGGELAVLVADVSPRLHLLEYQGLLRRYRALGDALSPGPAEGPLADLAIEADAQGRPARGWVAWVAAGEARVTWSEGPGGSALGAWNAQGATLGAASPVLPRLARLEGAVALLWAEPGGVTLRIHLDGDPPGSWSPGEAVDGSAAGALALAAAPGGRIIAAGAAAGGTGWVRSRSPAGAWGAPVGVAMGDPALVVDDVGERVHLFYVHELSGHRVVHRREGSLDSLDFGAPRLAMGWPGVDLEGPSIPSGLPEAAQELVVASLGDDGSGYFARVALGRIRDLQPPITLQHAPPPGTRGIAAGSAISFRIVDDRAGVDRASLALLVNGQPAAVRIRGVPGNFLAYYDLPADLPGPSVHVRIEARDLASPPNVMEPFEYDLHFEPAGEPLFRRGDANGDGAIDLSDVVKVLFVLFGRSPQLPCLDAVDANDDGKTNLVDPILLLGYLFLEMDAPPPPGPGCGIDETGASLGCAGETGCGG